MAFRSGLPSQSVVMPDLTQQAINALPRGVITSTGGQGQGSSPPGALPADEREVDRSVVLGATTYNLVVKQTTSDGGVTWYCTKAWERGTGQQNEWSFWVDGSGPVTIDGVSYFVGRCQIAGTLKFGIQYWSVGSGAWVKAEADETIAATNVTGVLALAQLPMIPDSQLVTTHPQSWKHYAARNVSPEVANTVVETDLISYNVVPNTLADGAKLRGRLHLFCSDGPDGAFPAGDFTVRAYYDGVQIASLASGVIGINAGHTTARTTLWLDFHVPRVGSKVYFDSSSRCYTSGGITTGWLYDRADTDANGYSTIFTADKIFKFTLQFANAAASIRAWVYGLDLEYLPPT